MDVTAQIEGADLVRLKDLVRAYGGFEITAGEFSVYSELQMKGGAIDGLHQTAVPRGRGGHRRRGGSREGASPPRFTRAWLGSARRS